MFPGTFTKPLLTIHQEILILCIDLKENCKVAQESLYLYLQPQVFSDNCCVFAKKNLLPDSKYKFWDKRKCVTNLFASNVSGDGGNEIPQP